MGARRDDPACPADERGDTGTVPSQFTERKEHLKLALRYTDLIVQALVNEFVVRFDSNKPNLVLDKIKPTTAGIMHYLESGFRAPGLPEDFSRRTNALIGKACQLRVDVWEARNASPHVDLPLRALSERLGMAPVEEDAMLFALLPALRSQYRRIYAVLQDEDFQILPTYDLILQGLRLLYGNSMPTIFPPFHTPWSTGNPSNERTISTTPALARTVEVDERIVRFLLENGGHDRRLASFMREEEPIKPAELLVSDEQREQLVGIAESLVKPGAKARSHEREDRASKEEPATKPVVVGAVSFHGPYGSGKLRAARALGRKVLVVEVETALRSELDWPLLVTLCYREAKLERGIIYWDGMESFADGEEGFEEQRQHLLDTASREAAGNCPVVTCFGGNLPLDPPELFHDSLLVRFGLPTPSVALRTEIWREHLPGQEELAPKVDRERLARSLARTFQLTEGQSLDAIAAARAQAVLELQKGGKGEEESRKPRLTRGHLETGCRRQSGRILHHLAVHVAPGCQTFDDIILSSSALRHLKNLDYRIRHRQRVFEEYGFDDRHPLAQGLLALFTGPSGTGKTLAAQIIASQNGVDLYKVDMSQLVSKWVGETEKNLSRIFAEATGSNAILFFDEADALFGKRGDVKDAHDRWANQEVNFLLQKIEEFAGVVLMATNLQQNIEPAFMRRIQTMIDFPFPGPDIREQIWTKLLRDEISAVKPEQRRFLAEQFALAGGSIRNAVFEAAFGAERRLEKSEERSPEDAGKRVPGYEESEARAAILLNDVILAIAYEYLKLGKPITRSEFTGELYGMVAQELFQNGGGSGTTETPGLAATRN